MSCARGCEAAGGCIDFVSLGAKEAKCGSPVHWCVAVRGIDCEHENVGGLQHFAAIETKPWNDDSTILLHKSSLRLSQALQV